MAIAKTDLKFYYTTLDHDASSADAPGSIGGYASGIEVVGGAAKTADLFDNDFSGTLRQYRCVAVRNESETETAYDVSFYLRKVGSNPSGAFLVAVEIPRNDFHSGTATGGGVLSLADSSIPSSFEDNHFLGAVVEMTGGANEGEGRVVASYDQETRTLVLSKKFDAAVVAGDTYVVHPAPAQRLLSGVFSPAFDGDRVSALSAPASADAAMTLDVHGNRTNGADLLPGDVAYVWFERSLSKNAEAFEGNEVVLAVRYRV